MLKRLRTDENADILLSMALSEVELGRLDGPYAIDQLDLDAVAIAPRFGVVQGSLNFVLLQLYRLGMCILLSGVKADGLPKVRAVDDMTASMINESTQQGEKLKCETLDLLFEVSKRLAAKVKVRAFFLVVIFPISCI